MVLVLLALAAIPIDVGQCRQRRLGPSGWESDGRGGLSVTTDARATGRIALRCRIRLSEPVSEVTVEWDRALVNFAPPGSKSAGSGLEMRAGGDCRRTLLRVAGEDWIESRGRAWVVELPAAVRTVEVELALVDASDRDPVRIDIRGLRVWAGRRGNPEPCP